MRGEMPNGIRDSPKSRIRAILLPRMRAALSWSKTAASTRVIQFHVPSRERTVRHLDGGLRTPIRQLVTILRRKTWTAKVKSRKCGLSRATEAPMLIQRPEKSLVVNYFRSESNENHFATVSQAIFRLHGAF